MSILWACGLPFRIELFDDEIESLREFDTETQRTIEKIKANQCVTCTRISFK